jgi:hypothetical protein
MYSEQYAPGEMLERIKGSAPVVVLPGDMDVILYLVIIFKNIPIDEEQRITVKNGVLQLTHAPTSYGKPYRLAVRDFKGDVQFLALLENDEWRIIRSNLTEKELLLLEHTYDKVRSSMHSIDSFINEYPPIGIT